MKKFLVILLVLMTCFVANVNAQEWTFLYKTNFGSSGELTLYKKNDEYAVQYKGASGTCKHGLTFEGINLINDEIHIVLGNKVNYCEKVKLIINKDGLGGRQELNINGQWVYDNVKDNLKFIRGSSLSELLQKLLKKNKNLIAQVQNQELSNTKIIDDKINPLITIPVNITQAESEKAKTPDTNGSADQNTAQLVLASSMAWALPIQYTVDQPLRITKYSGPNDSLSLEINPLQKVLVPFSGILLCGGGIGCSNTDFVILHENNLVSVISSPNYWEKTTDTKPGGVLLKGQELALIRGDSRGVTSRTLRWYLYHINDGFKFELSLLNFNFNSDQLIAENEIQKIKQFPQVNIKSIFCMGSIQFDLKSKNLGNCLVKIFKQNINCNEAEYDDFLAPAGLYKWSVKNGFFGKSHEIATYISSPDTIIQTISKDATGNYFPDSYEIKLSESTKLPEESNYGAAIQLAESVVKERNGSNLTLVETGKKLAEREDQQFKEPALQKQMEEQKIIQLAEEKAKQRTILELAQKEQVRLAEEAKFKEQQRLAFEAQQKEQLRLAKEAKQKEQEKLLAEQKAKEQLRLAEEAKLKEQQRLAFEAQQKEQARLAQEAKQKEQDRLLADQKAKEQLRIAEEIKLKDQQRLAFEAQQKELVLLAEAAKAKELVQLTRMKELEAIAEAAKSKDLELAKLKEELARVQEQNAKQKLVTANRRAFVVGNDSYKQVNKLFNSREDARTIADNLSRVGYSVTTKLDMSEREMRTAWRIFKSQIQPGDEVAFFYAGHGVQLGNTNYLLPVDVSNENEDQIKDEGMTLQRILDDLSERKARFSIAMIDACRDNPFVGSGRNIGGTSRGLAPTTAATGQMIIFSAGAGQQALDRLGPQDKNKNGVFTRVFVKEMLKPGISVDRVVRNVRNEVVELARSIGHEQVPAIYDQVVGEFFFSK